VTYRVIKCIRTYLDLSLIAGRAALDITGEGAAA
jgi:hypothetical protein